MLLFCFMVLLIKSWTLGMWASILPQPPNGFKYLKIDYYDILATIGYFPHLLMGGSCTPQHTYRSQRTSFQRQVSPPTAWSLELKLSRQQVPLCTEPHTLCYNKSLLLFQTYFIGLPVALVCHTLSFFTILTVISNNSIVYNSVINGTKQTGLYCFANP